MSFDDDKWNRFSWGRGGWPSALQPMPTRTGQATGQSNERTMLDEAGGPSGIVKRFRGGTMLVTKNGMPRFITLESDELEQLTLGVDHGIIQLGNLAPESPTRYVNGTLRYTAFVASNLNGDNVDTPIMNVITPPKTLGGPLAEGSDAPSFTLNDLLGASAQDTLWAQKITLMYCPASLFTGRTRLYVQALYGSHEKNKRYSLIINFLSAPNYLKLNTVGGDGSQVSLTTGSGIYYDAAGAAHWIIQSLYDSVECIKLKPDAAAAKLYARLTDGTLSAADKERVETYILAYSKPDLSTKQTVAVSAVSPFQFGYSWHFNWTGDRCDIVVVSDVPIGSGQYEQESTHYRRSFTLSGGEWVVVQTIVEGPTRWRHYKYSQVLAYPEWSEKGLTRQGTVLGPAAYGDAPYYAFYVRDNLKVARFSAEPTSGSKTGTSSQPYIPVDTGDYYSCGADEFEIRLYDSWSGSTVELSCGEYSVSHVVYGKTGTRFYRSSPQLNLGDVQWPPWSFPYPIASGARIDGYPTSIATAPYSSAWGSGVKYAHGGGAAGLTHATVECALYEPSELANASFTNVQSTLVKSKSAAFLSVVPFNDAEAIYIMATATDMETETGFSGSGVGNFYSLTRNTSGTILATAEIMDDPFPTPTTPYSDSTSTTETEARLVCVAGTLTPTTMPGASAFFDSTDLDVIPQTYTTLSSAAATGNAAIVSSVTGVLSGADNEDFGNAAFAFTGWA